MSDSDPLDLPGSYDRVAVEYAANIYDELQHKPFDREWLERFAGHVRPLGPACDIGSGPGQVARFLHDAGVEALGLDLSAAMVEQARRLNPGIEFMHADMRALPVPDEAWGGITAFYSIIHIPSEEVPATLREWRRVLKPGGYLLLAFHLGEGHLHVEVAWGERVNLDFFHYQVEQMAGYLEGAGFEIVDAREREPYPDVEYQSRRGYLFARKR